MAADDEGESKMAATLQTLPIRRGYYRASASSDASGEELVAAFTPSLWWRYDVDGMIALTRRVRGGWRLH